MNWLVVLALIPLLWRLGAQFLPAQWTEPYAYWDSDSLNDGVASWGNMGYWVSLSIYPQSEETDRRRERSPSQKPTKRSHVAFSNSPMHSATTWSWILGTGPVILSVRLRCLSSGDTWLDEVTPLIFAVMHLESNPKHLVAIASLPADTETAQRRVNQYFIEHTGVPTETTWYTGSASFRPNKDFDHPLYPMRGFLGEKLSGEEVVEDVEEQVVFDADSEVDDSAAPLKEAPKEAGPEPYDLVYILDAIYHFPPNLGAFVKSVQPSLRKGSGVLAYTDIIAPPAMGKFPGRMLATLIATLVRIPPDNLTGAPKSIADYKDGLENMGYINVRVEDWTQNVFPGLATNLKARGGVWQVVGWMADKAASTGWKFVAVRVERPA